MIVERVDQRDIQRLGGSYAKYPSSHVVCSLIKKYGIVSVLDVTYGEGRFYRLCRDRVRIIASDPVKRDWVVKPDRFTQASVFQLYRIIEAEGAERWRSNAVVVDPPKWTRNAVYRKRDMLNYIIGTPELIVEYASKVAQLVRASYVLVHYKRMLQLSGYKPVHVVEYRWLHRYLRATDKNHSLYIVYSADGGADCENYGLVRSRDYKPEPRRQVTS
jgi:hypothetical protein